MIHKTINLKDEFPMLDKSVKLISYCPDNFEEISISRRRKTLLLLPGGAYCFNSDREGEPVALRYMGHDINVFMLDYSHGPYVPPYPFVEAFAALAYIRRHADEYHVETNSIGVIGFSAGGHLAASLGAFYNKREYWDFLLASEDEIKPNALILGYPVIDLNDHEVTANNLLLNAPDKKDEYCVEKQVTSCFPPTFIWTCNDDALVSSMSSLSLALALKKSGVRFELHHYAFGNHGGSIGEPCVNPDNVDCQTLKEGSYYRDWVERSIRFLDMIL